MIDRALAIFDENDYENIGSCIASDTCAVRHTYVLKASTYMYGHKSDLPHSTCHNMQNSCRAENIIKTRILIVVFHVNTDEPTAMPQPPFIIVEVPRSVIYAAMKIGVICASSISIDGFAYSRTS